MLAIVDYDAGNTRNVMKALDYLGLENVLTADPDVIRRADGVVVPGVGAFQKAMAALAERRLVTVLQEVAAAGTPLLGICLGMQLLFDTSYEFGQSAGLGILPGQVVPIPAASGLKVPHMGWNQNHALRSSRFADVFDGQSTYFVHSFYVQTASRNIVCTADYGVQLPSVVQQGNVVGMQFHPEKSGQVGLAGLRAFKEMVTDAQLSSN